MEGVLVAVRVFVCEDVIVPVGVAEAVDVIEGVNVTVGEEVAVGVAEALIGSGLLVNAVPSSPVLGITKPGLESSGCDDRQRRLGTVKAQMAVTSSSAQMK